jgi:hypothetical protein
MYSSIHPIVILAYVNHIYPIAYWVNLHASLSISKVLMVTS